MKKLQSVKENVQLPLNILFLCRNRATASEHIFCAETENVQLIFFYVEDCMTASRNISMLFNERAAAS